MKRRPTHLRLLITNLALFIGIVVVIAATWNYWRNFFSGPAIVDDNFLLNAGASSKPGELIRYVELSDRQLIGTGWEGVMTQDGKCLYSDEFFIMPVKDQFMLVQADSPADGRRLIGPLYKFNSPVEREIYGSIQSEHPEWRGRVLPTMINGKAAFHVIGYLGLIVLCPLTVLSLVNIFRAICRAH